MFEVCMFNGTFWENIDSLTYVEDALLLIKMAGKISKFSKWKIIDLTTNKVIKGVK